MADGATHGQWTIAGTAAALLGLAVYGWRGGDINNAGYVGFALGGFSGLILSPDLDVPQMTHSEILMFRRFGPLGWLWFVFWWPYAKMIPHRHFLSHFPLVGTLLRLAYLCWPCLVILWLTGFWPLEIPPVLWDIGRGFLWGLVLSDILHWIADGFPVRL